MGEAVAEAEDGIKGAGVKGGELAKARPVERDVESGDDRIGAGPFDHGPAGVGTDNRVASRGEGEGVAAGAASGVEHAVGAKRVEPFNQQRQLVGQALVPVHEAIIVLGEGIVKSGSPRGRISHG